MGLAERVESLPTGPGVYLFQNARGRVLYVGKAQNLRSRVRSYLRAGGDGRVRMPRMTAQASDVEVVVTPSVKDALLLENELIKRHKPPFNVRLRDDKQYLGLRLDPREPWPRLTGVRRFREDGALYFGPYTSSQAMREAVSNLRRIFPLRSCSDPVFRDYARRGRPCIEFEMGRCLAPCVGLVDEAAYAELVEGTALFLRGRSDELLRELRARMEAAASATRRRRGCATASRRWSRPSPASRSSPSGRWTATSSASPGREASSRCRCCTCEVAAWRATTAGPSARWRPRTTRPSAPSWCSTTAPPSAVRPARCWCPASPPMPGPSASGSPSGPGGAWPCA